MDSRVQVHFLYIAILIMTRLRTVTKYDYGHRYEKLNFAISDTKKEKKKKVFFRNTIKIASVTQAGPF